MVTQFEFHFLGRSFISRSLVMVAIVLLVSMVFSAGIAQAGTTPAITGVSHKTGCNKILVTFNMPVFATANGTGALAAADFAYGDVSAGNMASISSVAHTAGNNWAVLTMDVNSGGTDATNDTLKAVANSIFSVGGALSEKTITLGTSDGDAPTFAGSVKSGEDVILIDFTDLVWATNMCTSAFNDAETLVNADFGYTNNEVQGDPTVLSAAAIHLNARDKVVLDLDANVNAGAIDNAGDDTINVAVGAVFDLFGNAVAISALALGALTADSTVPAISSVEAVPGMPNILVQFSEPVFGGAAGSQGALDNTTITNDLAYVETGGGGKTINAAPAISHVAGNDWILLTLSGNVTAADITAATQDTIAAAATAVHDALSNSAATTAVGFNDTTDPTIISLTRNNTGGKNTLAIAYSEGVTCTGCPSAGGSGASTTSVGDFTTAGTIAGFGAFGTAGDATYSTLGNTGALNAAATTFTFTLAGQTNAFRTAGTTQPSGTFTPTISVVDLDPDAVNPMETTSVQTTITNSANWDMTAPSQVTSVQTTGVGATNVNVAWSPVSDPSDFQQYKVYYRLSTSGTTFSNGTAWTSANDTNLANVGASTTSVTGLSTGFTYYFVVYALDTEGNPSTVSSEINVATSSGTTTSDTTATSAPTALTATQNADGHVVLSWTDPTATDLSTISIYRSKNMAASAGKTKLASVNKSVKTYTDTAVAVGDVLSYQLAAVDTSLNYSSLSAEASITVVAQAAETEVVDEAATEEVVDDTVVDEAVVDEAATDDADDGMVDEDASSDEDGADVGTTEPLTEEEEIEEAASSFSDVPTGNVYYRTPVGYARKQGWVQASSTFRPGDVMNRCEFAVVAVNAKGIAKATDYTDTFTDLPGWCKPYVYAGLAQGWWKGKSATYFGGSDNLLRAEVAVILSNMAGATSADEDAYTPADSYPEGWSLPYIRRVHKLGIMLGTGTGANFAAEAPVNRADGVVAIYRALMN